MMKLSRLLEAKLVRAPTDERPSVNFLYADGESRQLGRGWHMRGAESSQIKVYIVDDNKDAANLLGQAMAFYGYQTVVAFSSDGALQAIRREKPDVAILDLGMPGMSGVELARRLRETHATGDLLLIALTGWGQQEAGEAAMTAGFDFYFVKPADPGNLSALIHEEAFRRRMAGRG